MAWANCGDLILGAVPIVPDIAERIQASWSQPYIDSGQQQRGSLACLVIKGRLPGWEVFIDSLQPCDSTYGRSRLSLCLGQSVGVLSQARPVRPLSSFYIPYSPPGDAQPWAHLT